MVDASGVAAEAADEETSALLEDVASLSRRFGSDPEYTRGGGGNSSGKAAGVLYIKASGSSLADLTPGALMPLRTQPLLELLEGGGGQPAPPGTDEIMLVAMGARVNPDDGRRPSVEFLFHALLPEPIVLHTHPTVVNALTCALDGERIATEILGDDVLWVPYVDPGLPLARRIAEVRRAYEARTGSPAPRAILLQNHGMIVTGDSADEVAAGCERIVGAVSRRLDSRSPASAASPAGPAAAEPAAAEPAAAVPASLGSALSEALRGLLGRVGGESIVLFDGSPAALEISSTSAGRELVEGGPLTPDQIVYAGSWPLWLESIEWGEADNPDTVAAVLRERLDTHIATTGTTPSVVVVAGLGLFVVADSEKFAATARETMLDAMRVAQGARRLGGVRVLAPEERRFIEEWEAEAYRRGIAAGTPSPIQPETTMAHPDVDALIGRSNRLGADRRNTNFAGGNTSAKGEVIDPVTGAPVELLWVKGSGGDLGTLKEAGLAVLRLDRLRALQDVYPGVEREDEMVAAFDFCLHGRGGAAPSIDTAMHGLVDAPHVDHLHPDSGIAFATSADGEQLTRDCFGDRVAWIPWRRPGFQLGLDIATIRRDRPESIGVILGGHGITAWGDTSEVCEANSLDIIRTAERFIAERSRPEPFGPVIAGYEPLPEAERRARAAAILPTLRGLASTDRAQIGHYSDDDVVLDFVSREQHPRLAELGTSCPDHFLRTKVRPMVVDLPPSAPLEETLARIRELHAAYREDYRAYYERNAEPDSPEMRGADPAIVLVPGVGMFSFGANAQTARVAGEFYINAINVMRGAEGLSTYRPIPESEKFRIEYWALEEAKLQRMPKPKPLATRVAFVTGAGSGIGRAIAHRLAAEGACVIVADIHESAAATVARELGNADVAIPVPVDVTDEEQIVRAIRDAVLAFGGVDLVVNNAGLSISKALIETTAADWDLQHDVMARGSFLVSREAARVMIDQHLGGDIVYIASKNSLFAGPNNVAYGAAKADQAHQVRLLAAELGEHGIRVNGINPDGVVKGSGIFAGGWGAQRAAVYGVPEENLGEFYAKRTLLKREVLPEHVADAVFALVGGDLSQSTGVHIPVDSGVAAAFLR